MKLNYIFIPLIVVAVAVMGGLFVGIGMSWYQTQIQLPNITPPESTFGIVWNTIFILATIAIFIFWNQKKRSPYFKTIIGLLIINGLLNIFWSFLFFGAHALFGALLDAIILEISVLGIMVFLWPTSRLASLLFVPYALWGGFAVYLSYLIFQLN